MTSFCVTINQVGGLTSGKGPEHPLFVTTKDEMLTVVHETQVMQLDK